MKILRNDWKKGSQGSRGSNLAKKKGSQGSRVQPSPRVLFWPVHDSPDQGLPIVLILESLYTKLNVLDQLPFSQTLLEV